jgi:hypothetical protein
MVVRQFPGMSAWDGDDDTEVMHTHDGAHGEGERRLMRQFESAVWSRDMSEYRDRAR